MLCLACGGSERTASAPGGSQGFDDDEAGGRASRSSMTASSEIGALDEAKVDSAFQSAVSGLQRCLNKGASRVEFLGGRIAFYIKVDAEGRLAHAHLEESTIGDRLTEKCMLDVLGRKSWPSPVGGDMGYARKSFDFDPPNDVRPPTSWSSDNVGEALSTLSSKIDDCKAGTGGRFLATMYVGTEGEPIAVGIAPPDERGEAAVDCLVDTLKSATYPSPGSWPAKVSFTL
jgi:hypothetical protein